MTEELWRGHQPNRVLPIPHHSPSQDDVAQGVGILCLAAQCGREGGLRDLAGECQRCTQVIPQ